MWKPLWLFFPLPKMDLLFRSVSALLWSCYDTPTWAWVLDNIFESLGYLHPDFLLWKGKTKQQQQKLKCLGFYELDFLLQLNGFASDSVDYFGDQLICTFLFLFVLEFLFIACLPQQLLRNCTSFVAPISQIANRMIQFCTGSFSPWTRVILG